MHACMWMGGDLMYIGFLPAHARHKQKRKALLRDISMHVGPGELCYLMGPSGAGKTTLLEVLAGRVQIGACWHVWAVFE